MRILFFNIFSIYHFLPTENDNDAHSFLRTKRLKRANRWYNPIEEIFEGNLEKECIEGTVTV